MSGIIFPHGGTYFVKSNNPFCSKAKCEIWIMILHSCFQPTYFFRADFERGTFRHLEIVLDLNQYATNILSGPQSVLVKSWNYYQFFLSLYVFFHSTKICGKIQYCAAVLRPSGSPLYYLSNKQARKKKCYMNFSLWPPLKIKFYISHPPLYHPDGADALVSLSFPWDDPQSQVNQLKRHKGQASSSHPYSFRLIIFLHANGKKAKWDIYCYICCFFF